MKWMRLLLFACVFGLSTPMVAFQSGCSLFQSVEDSPKGVYFEFQEVFILAVSNANTAKRNGDISQRDWDTIWLPAINEGSSLLDQMESAYLSGDTESFNYARASLNAVIRVLEGGS